MIDSSPTTYAERRAIREQLQREAKEGVSLDPATKCVCPNCNQIHYKAKKEQLNDRAASPGRRKAAPNLQRTSHVNRQ
jgi:hypothetical protein